MLRFRLGDTELNCDSPEGTLGKTFTGDAIVGGDVVRMVSRGKKKITEKRVVNLRAGLARQVDTE